MVWHSALRLIFTQSPHSSQTRLSQRAHQGVLRVQRALYPELAPQQGICHLMLLYPPSGIAGGDNLAIEMTLMPTTHAVITTPGANKWYGMPHTARSPATATKNDTRPNIYLSGHQTVQVTLADHARLEWLPQETLFYNQTHANATNHIYLADTASFIGWEINVLGRQAYQENFTEGALNLRTFFWRLNGSANAHHDKLTYKPIFTEILSQKFPEKPTDHHTTDTLLDWRQATIANNNHRIFATLWAIPTLKDTKNLSHWVEILRNFITTRQLGIEVTATDNVLLVRYLGEDVRACFSAFSQIRGELRRLMWDLDNHEPRIWAT